MERFESPLVLYVNGKIDLVEACNAIRNWSSGRPLEQLGDAAGYLEEMYQSHQIGEHVHKKLLNALYAEKKLNGWELEDDGDITVLKPPANISEDETVIQGRGSPALSDEDATTIAPDFPLGDDDATAIAPTSGLGDDDATAIVPGMGDDDATMIAGAEDDDATVVSTQPGEATRMINEINEELDRKEQEHDKDELGAGSVLKGRFNLVSVLGEGGMGRVYKAIDMLKVEAKDMNPYVAIKLLTGDFKEHPDAFIALQRETSKAQKLAHPNISTVFDFDRHEETVYMTMELLEGTPLDTFIKRMPEGGLEIEQALGIVQDLGAGLGYAHSQGLVHSDFKPGNAFLLDDGSVKVIDFGIARAAATGQESDAQPGPTTATSPAYSTSDDTTDRPFDTNTNTNTNTSMTDDVFDAGTLGALTPAYATIEMFEGKVPHPSDDIYALACVAVQLLTGKHPFNKKSAPKARDAGMKPPVIPGLTSRQQKTLEKALAFDREQRTNDMEEFLDGIRKRKSYVKQIALGSIVSIALISAIGYKPVMEYYEQKELDDLIARTNSGTDAYVRSTLASLDDYSPTIQNAITNGVRDRAVGIFTAEIGAAVDFEAGRFDFATADAVIEEALGYYPDSAAIKQLDNDIDTQRANMVEDLEQEFYTHLVKKNFYPNEAEREMSDVISMLAILDADNRVLDDPRLEYGYYKGAVDNLDQDAMAAFTYADIGDRYIPDSELFAELKDRITLAALSSDLSIAFDATATADDAADLDTGALAPLDFIEHGMTDAEAVEAVARIQQDLTTYGNAGLAQYNADYPSMIDTLLEQQRYTLADWYNRLYSELLLDETTVRSQEALAETTEAYQQYMASLTLLADEENDKRIFRNISSQNRLNDSVQVYTKLAKHSSDETFLAFARNEISRMYLTLAETNAAESEFARALGYAESAQQYVEDERTAELVESYRKEIIVEELPAKIVSRDEELTAEARDELRYLRKTFPDDYPFFINRIAAVVNEDIIIMASDNLLDAHRLKDHALGIVESRIIRNVAIKPLPEPSKLALQGKIEVSQHRLSAARSAYLKAREETPDHYQVDELKELLDAELAIANAHFRDYQRHYGNEDYVAADRSLTLAQEAWIDNTDFGDERSFYDRILSQVDAEALLCREDIQGLGKQSRGVCRDKLLTQGGDAPVMVVIPAATTRDTPYAISKFEVSNAEFNLFCEASGACEANANSNPALPAMQVPVELVQRYGAWLSEQTGFAYDLADKSRWINAASAGGREGNTNYNCRLRLGTKMIKGQNMVPVTSGTANNWGLVNYVGNADELVRNGDAYELVGGNFSDSISDCKITLSKPVDDNYELAGFRLVRALN